MDLNRQPLSYGKTPGKKSNGKDFAKQQPRKISGTTQNSWELSRMLHIALKTFRTLPWIFRSAHSFTPEE